MSKLQFGYGTKMSMNGMDIVIDLDIMNVASGACSNFVIAPLSISSFGLIALPLVTQLQYTTFYSLNYG